MRSYDDATDDDILRDPETQCDWLREIGFEQVDTYFKLPGLAVFGGPSRKETLMEPVKRIEGRVQVLDRADVDTDQIIPKQFLKRIERTRLRRVPLLRLAPGGARARARAADPRQPAATSAAAPRASTRCGR